MKLSMRRLELARSVEAKSILILGDSQLVMGQINGTYKVKEEQMRKYLNRVIRPVKGFKEADFIQIPREENVKANTLAKEALGNEAMDEFDEI